MSRWPIRRESSLTFGSARVQFAELSGPRGLLQVYGLVMDAWWFDQSQSRQDAVRELLSYVHQAQDTQAPLIICGDFNADPDSDEIRMLTGRTTAPAPGLSFYDAWETAGPPAAGTPGPTTIPGPPSSCGLTAGSTTSFPLPRATAAPATPCTPLYSAPTPSTTPTPPTTTPCNPASATDYVLRRALPLDQGRGHKRLICEPVRHAASTTVVRRPESAGGNVQTAPSWSLTWRDRYPDL
jgi:Endonuclease/Exonuclease/phosphatase family